MQALFEKRPVVSYVHLTLEFPMSTATLDRPSAIKSPEESIYVRVARGTVRAQQVFGGKPDYAADWLCTAMSALVDRTPMQALVTESGALAVEELLVGIEHGMFA